MLYSFTSFGSKWKSIIGGLRKIRCQLRIVAGLTVDVQFKNHGRVFLVGVACWNVTGDNRDQWIQPLNTCFILLAFSLPQDLWVSKNILNWGLSSFFYSWWWWHRQVRSNWFWSSLVVDRKSFGLAQSAKSSFQSTMDRWWIGTGIAGLDGSHKPWQSVVSRWSDCSAALLARSGVGDLAFPTTGRPCFAEETISTIGGAMLTLILFVPNPLPKRNNTAKITLQTAIEWAWSNTKYME